MNHTETDIILHSIHLLEHAGHIKSHIFKCFTHFVSRMFHYQDQARIFSIARALLYDGYF